MKCSTCNVVRFSLNNSLCETCSFEDKYPTGRLIERTRRETKGAKKKIKYLLYQEAKQKQLNLLGVETYPEFLRTEYWRITRQRIIKADNGKCQACYSDKSLHVHHNTYARLGCEADNDLVTLCEACHNDLHAKFSHYKENRKKVRRRFKSLEEHTDVFIKKKRRQIKREERRKTKKALERFNIGTVNKSLPKIKEIGDLCRLCETPVVKHKRKKRLTKKQLSRRYNYKAWLKCPKCRTVYYRPEWKMTEKERQTWSGSRLFSR